MTALRDIVQEWYERGGASPEKRAALQSLSRLATEIIQVEDRTAGILEGVLVDESLQQALWTRFANDTIADALLGNNRPLGRYASRWQFAHCIGIVGDTQRDNLRGIGEVRNIFAHVSFFPGRDGALTSVSFDSPQVASICRQLWIPDSPSDLSMKKRFAQCAIFLAMGLWMVRFNNLDRLAEPADSTN